MSDWKYWDNWNSWNKRIKCFFMVAVSCLVGILTACSGAGQNNISKNGIGVQADFANTEESLKIVCTTFPQYDWVRQILGENSGKSEVIYLLKNGVDIHNYQPSAEDMIAISNCDLLIYVGGQSEEWLEDAQKNRRNPNQKRIAMMEVLGDRIWKEELVEGMQKEEFIHTEHTEHHENTEYDEHIWLSLKNAKQICQEISDTLGELDSVHQTLYQENTETYLKQLDLLDRNYQEFTEAAEQKTVLFADRFPFRYLVEDYGLDYYAAFAGCSAETEASFETITFLAGKADELNLPVIYRIETSDDSIAQTVVNSTVQKNQKILVLDSLQAVTEKEIEEGCTYLSVMEQNLELLKQGLNSKSDK